MTTHQPLELTLIHEAWNGLLLQRVQGLSDLGRLFVYVADSIHVRLYIARVIV